MFIRVATGEATVEDLHNFRQLHVELTGDGTAIPGLGTIEGDHAWLDIPALRAHGDGTESWQASFDGMIAYAGSKGWVEGPRVRAHVVRT